VLAWQGEREFDDLIIRPSVERKRLSSGSVFVTVHRILDKSAQLRDLSIPNIAAWTPRIVLVAVRERRASPNWSSG
jgi:hypothetical protein